MQNSFAQRMRLTPPLVAVLVLGLVFSHLTAATGEAAPGFHAGFDAVLHERVSDGVVDYPAIANDPRFGDYVALLRAPMPEGLSREEELAYLINAYNALSIQGILDGHSPKSLFGRLKFFKRIDYIVGGREIDLYDLERKVIIPLGDPRIHFAIVCASYSCPPLRSEAYVAERLDVQLDDQARRFLNDRSKNSIDQEKNELRLSKIFDWYKDEFVEASGSVQRYVAQFIEDPEIAADLNAETYRVRYLKYDWSLNGKPVQK